MLIKKSNNIKAQKYKLRDSQGFTVTAIGNNLKLGTKRSLKLICGFSLVEFIVYTALLVVVVLFLFQFLLSALNSESRGRVSEEVINNTITTINAIDFEIKHATSIYDPNSDFISDPGQLSLLTRNNPIIGEINTYADIFVDSNQRLCIRKEKLSTQCITSEDVVVTELTFEKIDLEDATEDGIRTTLSIEYNTTNSDLKVPFSLESFSQLRSY